MINRFYQDVICILTNEGKNLFAKQSNGIKFSKVGAVLFSDKNNSIKSAYEIGKNDGHFALKNITLQQLKNYTTIIYRNISYTLEGDIYIPDDYDLYNKALNDYNNLLPIQIAYGTNQNKEKYISYDFVLSTDLLTINRVADMNFDGLALVGLPFKQLSQESNIPIIEPQNLCLFAMFYFPKDTEKLQILHNQPKNVALNVEMQVDMGDPIQLEDLEFITNKGLEAKRPKRFLFGIHLTNDGLHNKG